MVGDDGYGFVCGNSHEGIRREDRCVGSRVRNRTRGELRDKGGDAQSAARSSAGLQKITASNPRGFWGNYMGGVSRREFPFGFQSLMETAHDDLFSAAISAARWIARRMRE